MELKKFLILFISIILPCNIMASDGLKDSVRIKIDRLILQTENDEIVNKDLKSISENIFNLSKKIGFTDGIGISFFNLAKIDYDSLKFESTIEKLNKAIKYLSPGKNYKVLIEAHHLLARALFRQSDIIKSAQNFHIAKSFIQQTNDTLALFNITNDLGFTYKQSGIYDSALTYFNNALIVAKKMNDKQLIARSNNNIGTVYYHLAQYDEALQYYLNSLKIRKEFNNYEAQALVLNNIGMIFTEINDKEKAFTYFEAALEAAEKSKSDLAIAYSINNLGSWYYSNKTYEKANEYYLKSLEKYKFIQHEGGQLLNLKDLAKSYIAQGNYYAAEKYLNRALKMALHRKEALRTAEVYELFGKLFEKHQSWRKAIKNYKLSLNIAEKIKKKELQISLNKDLSRLYEHNGNIDLAFSHFKKYNAIFNEVFNQKSRNRIESLEREGQKNKQEAELSAKKLELASSNYYRNLSIFFMLTFILISIGLFVFYKRSHETNITLNTNNELIKEQKSELLNQNNVLQKLSTTKDKVFSVLAHDLKNPFMTLLGYSDIMLEDYEDLSEEEKLTYIQSINDVSKNTFNLLENILQWAKSQTGNMKTNPKSFNIDKVIYTALEVVKYPAQQKDIELKFEPNSFKVYADVDMVEIIMRNLISNAIKFSKSKDTIVIETNLSDNKVSISIKDEGVGMEKELVNKLYSDEIPESQYGTSGEKGTGIGIQLCKDFIKLNNGEFHIKSTLGKGSNFGFTLPTAEFI